MELTAQRAAYVRKLEEAVRTVVATLSEVPGVERISLFGSYAGGRRDLGTDLDVLVVWETDKPFGERLRTLYSMVSVPVDLDLVCYTPAEFRGLRGSAFLRHVSRGEVVLYEKKPA